jgi:hypothetical protein
MNEYKNKKDEQKTNKWLADNGISEEALKDAKIWQLSAQKVAAGLLKHHIDDLSESEIQMLMGFSMMMENRRMRAKLSSHQSYVIMNLGKRINRKLFKKIKQIH